MRRSSLTIWLSASAALVLAIGLVASRSGAQGGTPVPETTPAAVAGQSMEPIAIGLFEQIPTPPVVFDLSRATFAPGASTPPGPDAGPSLTYVMAGQLRFLLDGPATVTRLGVGPQPATTDEIVEAGNWIVIPAGTGFQAINEESDDAIALVTRLMPLPSTGTGTPSPEAVTPSPAMEANPPTASPIAIAPALVFEPLAGGVVAALPPTPLAVALTRLTFDPGTGDPMPSQNPGPLIGYVERGQIGYTLASGEAVIGRSGAAGITAATPGTEVTLNAGDWLFEQAGTASQGRNPGDTPASILLVVLAQPEAFLGIQPVPSPAASPSR